MTQPTIIVVQQTPTIVDVENSSTEVEVVSRGIQGPPGPQGPPGASTSSFTEPFVAMSVVVVNHNLGFKPNVTILVSDIEVEADVVHNSINSLTVTFNTAQTGSVVCS